MVASGELVCQQSLIFLADDPVVDLFKMLRYVKTAASLSAVFE